MPHGAVNDCGSVGLGGRAAASRGPGRERILRILEKRPRLSMYGLRDALAAEGVAFYPGTMQRFLKRQVWSVNAALRATAASGSRRIAVGTFSFGASEGAGRETAELADIRKPYASLAGRG